NGPAGTLKDKRGKAIGQDLQRKELQGVVQGFVDGRPASEPSESNFSLIESPASAGSQPDDILLVADRGAVLPDRHPRGLALPGPHRVQGRGRRGGGEVHRVPGSGLSCPLIPLKRWRKWAENRHKSLAWKGRSTSTNNGRQLGETPPQESPRGRP